MESRPRSGHNCLFKPAEASHGAEGGLEEVISLTSGEEDAAEPRLREEHMPPSAYPAVEASGEVSEGRVQVGASVDEKSASPVEPETSDDTGSTEPCPSTQSVPLAVHGQ